LIIKYANQQTASPYFRGYKIKIGDTIKFGRVRFKVIMISNEIDGDQTYKETRFNNHFKETEKKNLVSIINTISEDDLDEEEDDMGDYDEEEEDEEERQDIDYNNNGFERGPLNRSRLASIAPQQHLNMTHHREIEVEEHLGDNVARIASN
jgi:hypothetical protein